jgi:5-methylthioadenosine/S-adenosylhomocysteine deaminase
VTAVYRAPWVVPVAGAPVADGAVAVEGSRIAAVGPAAEVLASRPQARVEELFGCILAPGLVNAHTHLEYAGYGGFGDGLAFGPWLHDHIARKRRLVDGDARALAVLGARACLAGGVTTVADASFAGEAVGAATEAGLRAVVALEAFGGSGADPVAVADDLDARLAARATEAGDLVELAVSPHAPYTVAPDVFAEIVTRARARGLRVITHLAESRAEIDALRDGSGPLLGHADGAPPPVRPFGRHPVAELAARGLLGPETLAVHVVHVGPDEIALLAEAGCAVAHCPRSNALLGCGTAPLAELRAAGLRVGVGTDSPASALSFDLFEELRAVLAAARARAEDPGALRAPDLLRLATIGGAEALGLGHLVGTLEPGKEADLVAVELGRTAFWPTDDPAAALVLGGRPDLVRLTLVSGAVRYRAGDGSVEQARARAAEARARMLRLPT